MPLKPTKLTHSVSVSPQIAESDLDALAAQGYRSVINNRPDGESQQQPASDAIAAAAERVGLAYRHVPVISGDITDDDVLAFDRALAEMEGPVLAFCRTGTRSTHLWALTAVADLDPAEIAATGAKAGYDLAALRSRLDERRRSVG